MCETKHLVILYCIVLGHYTLFEIWTKCVSATGFCYLKFSNMANKTMETGYIYLVYVYKVTSVDQFVYYSTCVCKRSFYPLVFI